MKSLGFVLVAEVTTAAPPAAPVGGAAAPASVPHNNSASERRPCRQSFGVPGSHSAELRCLISLSRNSDLSISHTPRISARHHVFALGLR